MLVRAYFFLEFLFVHRMMRCSPSNSKESRFRLDLACYDHKQGTGSNHSNVGVYLPDPVFSYGQLYIALSRATSRSNIKILSIPEKNDQSHSKGTFMKNIVYKEVLTA